MFADCMLCLPGDAHPLTMPCEDGDGAIFYRSASGQLEQLRGTNITAFQSLPGLRPAAVTVLVKDIQNRIWVGTDKESGGWNGKAFTDMTPTNGEVDVAVQQLLPCADGSCWVLTTNRLRKRFARCWKAEALVSNNGQPDLIESAKFFSRRTHFLWIPTAASGLRAIRKGLATCNRTARFLG